MSNSLFLPLELFQPQSSRPADADPAPPAAPAARRGALHFTSGADVAADLMQAMRADDEPAFVERRRKPRHGKAFDISR